MLAVVGGDAAIRGAMQRAAVLPLLLDPPTDTRDGNIRLAWSNNWADWDNSGGHNEWEDHSSGPPGGK